MNRITLYNVGSTCIISDPENIVVEGLLFLLRNLTWDRTLLIVADVLVTSLVLYGFFRTVKDTRSRYMFLGGLLVVAVLQAVTWLFKLPTVSNILTMFYSHAVLIFVILFQSDIRKALVSVGSAVARMRSETKIVEMDYLSEIVEAINRLSLHRIGALIVIERGDMIMKLPEVMGGYDIDAPVNRHLLLAIFQPSSSNSIHDGAVLVRAGRIARAGVMLPLTRTPLPEYFGSRHKAALGITDISDAISLVVSEERGTITLCEAGVLSELRSVEELRAEMVRLLQRTRLPEIPEDQEETDDEG